jgi:hypothetical protein
MAKANKTSFKKGQSGNPAGYPKMPDDVKAVMKATGHQVRKDICEAFAMDISEIYTLAQKTSGVTGGKAAIVSCLNTCIQNGDARILSHFLDRILGRPVEMVHVDDDKGDSTETTKDLLVGQFVSMLLDRRAEPN